MFGVCFRLIWGLLPTEFGVLVCVFVLGWLFSLCLLMLFVSCLLCVL